VKISVPEGETVSVGTEVAQIEADGSAPSADSASGDEAETPEPAPEPGPGDAAAPEGAAAQQREAPKEEPPQPKEQGQPPSQGEAPPSQSSADRPSAPGSGAVSTDVATSPAPVETAELSAAFGGPTASGADAEASGGPDGTKQDGSRSQILSPLVRRMAEENDIDLSQVSGTGTGGRITKKDVEQFVASRGQQPQPEPPPQPTPPEPVPSPIPVPQPGQPQPGSPQPAPPTPPPVGPAEEAIPVSRMRQAIAQHMVESIQTSARAWNLVEVNMENVVRVRNGAKDAFREREGINLTFMPFVGRAVCEALLAFPDVNAELRGDQLIIKRYVNLGIAVALDDGLIVPVVKGADTMNVVGVARAINDLATRARTKKLMPDDVHGGTFTITNPGPFGSIISVPIINTPQTAILAFDAIEKRPVVVEDAIAIRHMVYLSMSWDHRVIDGATAAKFLGRLKQNLETWDFGPEVGLAARA
jgi:pyruvate/2-oxoglutarate dehydrogenase complex dihydrolipoamide acyltransferase (E2) component